MINTPYLRPTIKTEIITKLQKILISKLPFSTLFIDIWRIVGRSKLGVGFKSPAQHPPQWPPKGGAVHPNEKIG